MILPCFIPKMIMLSFSHTFVIGPILHLLVYAQTMFPRIYLPSSGKSSNSSSSSKVLIALAFSGFFSAFGVSFLAMMVLISMKLPGIWTLTLINRGQSFSDATASDISVIKKKNNRNPVKIIKLCSTSVIILL